MSLKLCTLRNAAERGHLSRPAPSRAANPPTPRPTPRQPQNHPQPRSLSQGPLPNLPLPTGQPTPLWQPGGLPGGCPTCCQPGAHRLSRLPRAPRTRRSRAHAAGLEAAPPEPSNHPPRPPSISTARRGTLPAISLPRRTACNPLPLLPLAPRSPTPHRSPPAPPDEQGGNGRTSARPVQVDSPCCSGPPSPERLCRRVPMAATASRNFRDATSTAPRAARIRASAASISLSASRSACSNASSHAACAVFCSTPSSHIEENMSRRAAL